MSENSGDLRWIQRLSSFEKAFGKLQAACMKDSYTELERSGLIQTFEFTFDLAWKTLQDLLASQGYAGIVGPRPVIEQAFQNGLIGQGETWMEMLNSRNLATHIYEEKIAQEILNQVKSAYFPLLRKLVEQLAARKAAEDHKHS